MASIRQNFLNKWIEKKIAQVNAYPLPLNPAIEDLRNAIYNDAVLYMGFTSMYDQIPQGYNDQVKTLKPCFRS